MAQKKGNQNKPQWKSADHPEVRETFVDTLGNMSFDGNTMRIELRVARHDAPNPPHPPGGTHHTAVRLVLTPHLAAELQDKLNKLAEGIQKAQQQHKPATIQ